MTTMRLRHHRRMERRPILGLVYVTEGRDQLPLVPAAFYATKLVGASPRLCRRASEVFPGRP